MLDADTLLEITPDFMDRWKIYAHLEKYAYRRLPVWHLLPDEGPVETPAVSCPADLAYSVLRLCVDPRVAALLYPVFLADKVQHRPVVRWAIAVGAVRDWIRNHQKTTAATRA